MTDCSGLIGLEAVKQQFYNPIEPIKKSSAWQMTACAHPLNIRN